MIPVATAFRCGDYDDREVIASILAHPDVRTKMIKLSLGKGTMELGKWVQAELRNRDVLLTEVLERADQIAAERNGWVPA